MSFFDLIEIISRSQGLGEPPSGMMGPTGLTQEDIRYLYVGRFSTMSKLERTEFPLFFHPQDYSEKKCLQRIPQYSALSDDLSLFDPGFHRPQEKEELISKWSHPREVQH